MALQHLRSSTADKRPTPAAMAEGQLALNTNLASPGLFFKDSNGDLVKVGPVHVGTTAPNATPANGGQSGNSKGEQWLDTSSSRYVFKIWDGSAWRSEDGEFVNASGDTMTGALGIIAGSAASPSVFISGDTNTGIYSPGADQVAISTNGTGRLFVDASGNLLVGTSSSVVGGYKLQINGSGGITSTANAAIELGIRTPDATFNDSYISFGTSTLNRAQIYCTGPAANTGNLVFNTYNAGAGAERLRITSDGKLGLGTSSPGAVLESKTANVHAGDAAYAKKAVITNIPYSTSDITSSAVAIYDGTIHAADIGYSYDGTGYYLTFGTNDDTIGAPIERLRIDRSGRVGIGTTSVNTTLEVQNSSTPIIRVGDGTRHMELRGGSTTQNAAIGTNYGGGFDIIQNGSAAVTIDSSKRVLVGTSSGTAPLTVAGANIEVRSTNGAYINNSQTTSVSTSATTIVNDAGFQGRLWVINGSAGSDRFCDLVMASTAVAPVVVQSFNAFGSPAARTYTRSGSALQLAMASGTYDVRCIGMGA